MVAAAVEQAGGAATVAKMCGVRRQSVYWWIKEWKVERLVDALKLSRASGIPIERLAGESLDSVAMPNRRGPNPIASDLSPKGGSALQGLAALGFAPIRLRPAFAIVSRIARCSLPLLARILPASRSSADPSRLVTWPPASMTFSAPAATSHGRSPNSHNASTRPQAR